jgi:RNA polymerase sigma factor (sigma-70 family)
MPPPPAEQFASRLFLGPALRTQSDRRLVTLVRDGYEAAFEEIVRRYRKPLDRFAAAIVGGHSEDVTQDAFSKALRALRGSEAEIELRPWLYRIVRNTALNDLRDRPPATAELPDSIGAEPSAAAEAERREEMSELMDRLQALPEPQRAAIVMRELEGLSHEEIAAALGVSGGAARQAIHRARTALRDGFGMLVPLPLLRMLFDHGAEAAAGGALATSAAGGTAAAAFGGLGAGAALKLGAATVLVAGSIGAGVAIEHNRGGSGPGPASATSAAQPLADDSGNHEGGADGSPGGPGEDGSSGRRSHGGDDSGGHGPGRGASDDGGHSHDSGDDSGHHGGTSGGGSSGSDDSSGSNGRGNRGPSSGHGGGSGEDRSGSAGGGGSSHSGKGSGGSGGSGSGGSGGGSGHSGSGPRESGSGTSESGSGSGSSGASSGEAPPPAVEPAPESGGGDSGSGSGSGEGSGGGDS